MVSLLSDNSGVRWSREFVLGWEDGLRDVSSRLPLSEIAVNDGYHLVRIKITSHADGHVVGYIPLLKVVLNIRNRWVLQVGLSTNRGLRAIGVCRGKFFA